MPDLPPDVRAEATRAAHDAFFEEIADEVPRGAMQETWNRLVDAVVSAVAPELDNRALIADREFRTAKVGQWRLAGKHVEQVTALKARVDELEERARMWESRAKEVDAHRRALWDITGRDPNAWSEAHARAVLAKGEQPDARP